MKKTHFLKGSKAILFYLFVVLFTGCTYHDIHIEHNICGCKSRYIENIDNEGGIIVATVDGYMIISVQHGYLAVCDSIPKGLRTDGVLVRFSGQVIPTCKLVPSGYGLIYLNMKLLTIKKVDTLYVNESPQLRIVKTEDFGLQPGYGYTIYDVQKDFRLQQFAIPWIPSQIPYKTETDALKMAFVMGYRLENFKGYPYLVLADLYFTQIQGI